MRFSKSFKVFIQNLRRDPWVNFSPVIVLTLTFISLNFLIFILSGSSILLRYLEEKAQIAIYFTDATSEQKILETKKEIEADSRILDVTYISKEQALQTFKEWSKDDPALVESLQSNPLPASLEVRAKNIVDLQVLSEEYLKKEGVEEIKFFKDVVDKFRQVSNLLKVISLSLLALLSVASIVVVLITIGNTIHTKGIEVEIMKLVGASEKYVKAPLMLQGMFYGFVANFVSSAIVYLVVLGLAPYLNDMFSGLSVRTEWWELMFWAPFMGSGATVLQKILAFVFISMAEVLLGIILGYIGASLAIKKYLKY